MELVKHLTSRRQDRELDSEERDWLESRGTLEAMSGDLLPCEEHLHREMKAEAERGRARARAEKLSLGVLALGELMAQRRAGPAPRWFLLDPFWAGLETVVMNASLAAVTFEGRKARRRLGRITLPFRNELLGNLTYRARPPLIPTRVRAKVRELVGAGFAPRILFEPRVVVAQAMPEPILKPDPALIFEAGGAWYLSDLWVDEVAEDPRALNILREFYVPPPG